MVQEALRKDSSEENVERLPQFNDVIRFALGALS